MADEQEVKSKRDLFGERLKEKYPDKEYADDEALFGQINDDYDDYDAQISDRDAKIERYQKNEQEVLDAFGKNRQGWQFFADIADGKDPWVELIRREGSDNVQEMLNDPSKLEAFAQANKEYVERLGKEKELTEQAQANMAETATTLEQMVNEGKYTAEEIDQAMLFLRQVFEDAVVGKYSRESIEMAIKAQNHEADVEAAKSEGELAGRNYQIEEKMQRPTGGDGIPQLGGGGAQGVPQRRRPSIFEQAALAK